MRSAMFPTETRMYSCQVRGFVWGVIVNPSASDKAVSDRTSRGDRVVQVQP